MLKESENWLTTDEIENINDKLDEIKRQYNDSDISDIEKKAKEVAVSPEWVLSQEETKHWAESTKGVVEIIKLKNSDKKKFKKLKK